MRWTWWRSEAKRFWAASTLAAALAFPGAYVALALLTVPEDTEGWVGFLVFAIIFALAHAWLSLMTFRSLDSSELRRALRAGHRDRGLFGRILNIPGLRSLVGGSDAPAFGRQLALIALFAVGVMLIDPQLRGALLLRLLAILLVVSSWINLVVTYAVHYARLHALADSGLQFPGRDERTLWDYLYLSAAVQTTFGTTDVTVTTTHMRRTVTGHGVLAFLFNAVILVLSLSLLLVTG